MARMPLVLTRLDIAFSPKMALKTGLVSKPDDFLGFHGGAFLNKGDLKDFIECLDWNKANFIQEILRKIDQFAFVVLRNDHDWNTSA